MIMLILTAILILSETVAIPALSDEFTSHLDAAGEQLVPKNSSTPLQQKDLKIDFFKVTPKKLAAGQTAKLIWKVSGADRIFIDDNSDLKHAEVSPTGHLAVCPLKTTCYVLTVYDRHMIGASAIATIDVYGQPPKPLISLEADNRSILAGDKVTLKWETRFANTVSIDNGIGTVGSHGTIEVQPRVTTTYTLAATGLGGSKIANITIMVVNSQAANVISKKSAAKPSAGG